ncbi:hypothetical protein [Hymenobacter sp. 102]|uniref:hypothetical protein n=1 Tax=Hymenobacter sp. 102 TaxID=3403152 RepID=UPI003CF778D9
MLRISTFLTVCLLTALLAAGSAAAVFQARQQGTSVYLEWPAAREPGVNSYEVYRQDHPADDFDRIVLLTSTAQPHYRYTDENVLLAVTGRGPVTYRLAVCTQGSTHTYQTSLVQPEVDIVSRSWDTVKLMFR